MNPKNCTSQPLSRRLCEAGIKQESEFYWIVPKNGVGGFIGDKTTANYGLEQGCSIYSAFLTSELLEMLPAQIRLHKLKGYINGNGKDQYTITDCSTNGTKKTLRASTPSEALGEMLLHLITNGLIDPKGI